MPKTQCNIRVNPRDLRVWREQAKQEDRSLTELIRRAVDQYIERQRKDR